MPDRNLTQIVFVLDRSGSMESIRQATVDGLNNFLRHQSALPGRATITLVQFSTESLITWEALPVREACLRPSEYNPDGYTALFDAVASTIDRTGVVLAQTSEERRPAKVVFAILTDGEENSSRHATAQQVQAKIRHQSDVYGWQFLFLGASPSWLEQARELGIAAEDAAVFEPTELGMADAMMVMCESVERVRG